MQKSTKFKTGANKSLTLVYFSSVKTLKLNLTLLLAASAGKNFLTCNHS